MWKLTICYVRRIVHKHNLHILGGVHCVLYTVYCTMCTVHCVLYTVYCTLCSVHCTLCTVQCTLCTVHCTVYTVQCTLCTAGAKQTFLFHLLWYCRIFISFNVHICNKYLKEQLIILCTWSFKRVFKLPKTNAKIERCQCYRRVWLRDVIGTEESA